MGKPIRLIEAKRCSCGAMFNEVPAQRLMSSCEAFDGVYREVLWWNCGCKSTLMRPAGKIVGWIAPKPLPPKGAA